MNQETMNKVTGYNMSRDSQSVKLLAVGWTTGARFLVKAVFFSSRRRLHRLQNQVVSYPMGGASGSDCSLSNPEAGTREFTSIPETSSFHVSFRLGLHTVCSGCTVGGGDHHSGISSFLVPSLHGAATATVRTNQCAPLQQQIAFL